MKNLVESCFSVNLQVIQNLIKGIEKHPEEGQLYEQLGHIYYKRVYNNYWIYLEGQIIDAELNLMKGYQLYSVYRVTLLTLGILFILKRNDLGAIKEEKREYYEAITFYKEAFNKDPSSAEPIIRIAELLLLLKKFDDSIQYAHEAIKIR